MVRYTGSFGIDRLDLTIDKGLASPELIFFRRHASMLAEFRVWSSGPRMHPE